MKILTLAGNGWFRGSVRFEEQIAVPFFTVKIYLTDGADEHGDLNG